MRSDDYDHTQVLSEVGEEAFSPMVQETKHPCHLSDDIGRPQYPDF
jgi:hypothetical protein